MSRRVSKSGRIRDDLDEIFEFIARDDPGAALNVVEAIAATMREVEEFPELGRRTTLILKTDEEVRRAVVPKYSNYSVYYRLSDTELHFLFIHHAARRRPRDLG